MRFPPRLPSRIIDLRCADEGLEPELHVSSVDEIADYAYFGGVEQYSTTRTTLESNIQD